MPEPFEEAVLLIPLYQDTEQFGALVLGRPENGLRFAEEDIEHIIDPVDMIGEAVLYNRLRTRQIARATELARVKSPGVEGLIPVEIMENALRNLYDYATLRISPWLTWCWSNPALPTGQSPTWSGGKRFMR